MAALDPGGETPPLRPTAPRATGRPLRRPAPDAAALRQAARLPRRADAAGIRAAARPDGAGPEPARRPRPAERARRKSRRHGRRPPRRGRPRRAPRWAGGCRLAGFADRPRLRTAIAAGERRRTRLARASRGSARVGRAPTCGRGGKDGAGSGSAPPDCRRSAARWPGGGPVRGGRGEAAVQAQSGLDARAAAARPRSRRRNGRQAAAEQPPCLSGRTWPTWPLARAPGRTLAEGFVLRSLLDEALAAANRRLRPCWRAATPSAGGGAGRARRAVGLDIEVLDEWNGTVRPAGTLSGGEGFAPRWHWRSAWPTRCSACGARRIDALSSTRASARWTPRRWRRRSACWRACRPATGCRRHQPCRRIARPIPAKLEVTPGRRGSTAAFRIG